MSFYELIKANPSLIEDAKKRFILETEKSFNPPRYTELIKDISVYADGQLNIQFNTVYDGSTIHASITNPIELLIHEEVMFRIISGTNSTVNILYYYGSRSDKDGYGRSTSFLLERRSLGKQSYLLPHHRMINSNETRRVKCPRIVIPHDPSLVIYPDKSAKDRLCSFVSRPNKVNNDYTEFHYKKPDENYYIELEKERFDSKLFQTPLPDNTINFIAELGIKHIIVLDDLCDAGRSFGAIADAIPTCDYWKKTLVTIHGLYTFNYEENLKNFDFVISTDSYMPDIDSIDSFYYVTKKGPNAYIRVPAISAKEIDINYLITNPEIWI